MNTWETLVASALVGTDRQSPSINLTHPALADYQASLSSQSATQQILHAAGLIAAYQSVGNSPLLATQPLQIPAAKEELPCFSSLAARHLSAILNESRYESILPEFLQLLAQAGQTVTPDFIPLLLNLGEKLSYSDRHLRSVILSILGTRGQWLINQNPKWAYGLGVAVYSDPAKLQEIWQTGTYTERSAVLTQWRKIQPAEARQAIVASWKQDKADDRDSWLGALEPELSLDDEELLEKALFDRNERIRLRAAHLLSRLPSNYRQRITKLASQCVKISKKDNSYKIEITPPKADDKQWQDAGLYRKSILVTNAFKLKMSFEECLLYQALNTADLDVWGKDIEGLITAAVAINKNLLIINGLIGAACYQQRTDWIKALLTHATAVLEPMPMQQLLEALPETASNFRQQFFTELLTADNFCDTIEQTLYLMFGSKYGISFSDRQRNWNLDLSNLVVRQYHKYIQQLDPTKTYDSQEDNYSNLLGLYLDISVLPELKQMQAELSSKQLSDSPCLELLEFRRDMRSALNTA